MNKLKKLCTLKNITQSELSLKLDCAKSTVSMWSNGKATPSVKTIERIAEILHCKISEVLECFTTQKNTKKEE